MATRQPLHYYLKLIPSDELDQQIDDKHRNARGHILDKDLGKIAEEMLNWDGNIATVLELSWADIVLSYWKRDSWHTRLRY